MPTIIKNKKKINITVEDILEIMDNLTDDEKDDLDLYLDENIQNEILKRSNEIKTNKENTLSLEEIKNNLFGENNEKKQPE